MTDAIRAETVSVAGHDGDEIEAYLAQPLSDGPFGAVVVIHHFPGYDEETKEITRKFADHGYLALCPNLYSRQAPGATPEDAAATVRAQGGIPDEQLVGDVDGAARLSAGHGAVQRQGGDDRVLLGGPPVLPRRLQPAPRRRGRLLRRLRRRRAARRDPAQGPARRPSGREPVVPPARPVRGRGPEPVTGGDRRARSDPDGGATRPSSSTPSRAPGMPSSPPTGPTTGPRSRAKDGARSGSSSAGTSPRERRSRRRRRQPDVATS